MANRPRIWLTRPLADSEHFASQLAQAHIHSIIDPVMHIEHVPIALEDAGAKPTALLLTSRHAAQALSVLPAEWRSLPAYCVGGATEKAVQAMGFTKTLVGEGDVLGLLPRIAQEIKINGRILYLSAEETRADIPTLLGGQGIHVTSLVAYRALPTEALNPELIDMLRHGHVQGIALFSPKSASVAAQLLAHHHLRDAMSNVDAYCLSLNVAAIAGALNCRRLHTCHIPTAQAMHDLIVSLAPQTMV